MGIEAIMISTSFDTEQLEKCHVVLYKDRLVL